MNTFWTTYDAGFLQYLLLGEGRANYRINAMYLEFANVASPGDPVATPAVDRSLARQYYVDLVGADFLRVPIRGLPELSIASGFEDVFTEGETGNQVTWYAQSSGTSGVLGLPFSDAANSVIYGIALVAAPELGDWTRDIVFGRGYYAAANQIAKRSGRHIGVNWSHVFGPATP